MKRFAGLSGLLGGATLRQQLALAFGTLLALLLVLGITSIVKLGQVNAAASDLAEKWLPGVAHANAMRSALLEFREFEVKHTKAPDASYHAEYEDKMAAASARVGTEMEAYGKFVRGEAETALFDAFRKSWADYDKFAKRVVALGREGKQVDAQDISDGAASVAAMEAVAALDKLTAFNFEGGQAARVEATGVYTSSRALSIGLLAAGLLLGLGLATLITRSVLRQLGGEPHLAMAVATAVAEGDLSTPIPLRPGDRTSVMARLHDMQGRLAGVVASVREGSQGVATASAEIAQGNNDLSGRTEQQASALQQTAASMEQLGSTVRQNAESARRANELARDASAVAQRGGAAVGEVVGTMRGINDSSRRIADIIGVIDGIAFQTNILALNAAVEAARAGDHGRGFAVVASEVRNLAQRSASAAKEIKGLIGTSVERVELGTSLVDRAGATMKDVVDSIQRLSEMVAAISAASLEQSAGVAQVGDAVTAMDQATQQNAALVEQSAAAAESLRQQADALVEAVAVFRLSASGAPAHA
jgi:methyl-accepting chemotaxis protein